MVLNSKVAQLPHSDHYYEHLLKSSLVSFRDDSNFTTIPKLKEHLEQAWANEVKHKMKVISQDKKRSRSRDDSEPASPHKVLRDSKSEDFSQTKSDE